MLDLSGKWSERQGSAPLDNTTNIFAFDARTSTFTVTNDPAQWWQHGNGSVDFASGTMAIDFPHNPWPHGKPVSLSGTLYGTACPNISVVWDNDSMWCMRAGDGVCHGMPPPPPPPPNVSHVKYVHVVQVGCKDEEGGGER